MATPLSKRRKLNDTSALLKPFKSPLRDTQSNSGGQGTDARPPRQEAQDASRGSHQAEHRSVKAVTQRPYPARLIPTASTQLPEIAQLQRQHTALLNRLASTRAELDKVNQVLKIEHSTRDAELERLIKQWRSASQQAAEEVYADVRDRVNGMGGLRAWREREKHRAESSWGWEGEGVANEGQGEEEEERTAEAEQEGEEQGAAGIEEEENDSFTMDIMLRTLNIDLDLIGYGKEYHKWLD